MDVAVSMQTAMHNNYIVHSLLKCMHINTGLSLQISFIRYIIVLSIVIIIFIRKSHKFSFQSQCMYILCYIKKDYTIHILNMCLLPSLTF